MVIRRAIHAGSWYSGSKQGLIKSLKKYFNDTEFGPGKEPQTLDQEVRTILGAVSPHAGYEYSGYCAAHSYLNLFKEKIPDTVIVLGTDHHGYDKIALMEEGEWETPLGNLMIDNELSKEILKNSDLIISDNSAFTGFRFGDEHNIEIQLPFIKYCAQNEDVKIVTIKITPRIDFNAIQNISHDIAEAIKVSDKDIVIVASSDMSHKHVYSQDDLKTFKEIDQVVINEFIALNPKKTLENALKTSICGPQTITSLMLICINLNANNGASLKYYTSSEKTGQFGYCVGYFSGIITT